jgi:hypothetical protein
MVIFPEHKLEPAVSLLIQFIALLDRQGIRSLEEPPEKGLFNAQLEVACCTESQT